MKMAAEESGNQESHSKHDYFTLIPEGNGLLNLLENSVVAFVLISWQQEVSHQFES